MSTDRELLELAAKAVGMEIDPIDALHEPEDWCAWNPLESCGDALRLAVKLDMEVWQAFGEARATADERRKIFAVKHDDSRYAATRRAIVRAAAEIGKAMP